MPSLWIMKEIIMNIAYKVKAKKGTSERHTFIVEDAECRLISHFNTLKNADKDHITGLVRSIIFHDSENAYIALQWSALAMNTKNAKHRKFTF